MEQTRFYRKYIILKELDPGFGVQRPPEGFVRFEGNREGISVTLQIRNLREGNVPYTVILIFSRDREMGIFRVGMLELISRSGFLRRNLDYKTLHSIGMEPENILYVLIASELRDKVFIPLAGLCSKSVPWDESVRQRLLKREKAQEPQAEKKTALPEVKKGVPDREQTANTIPDKPAEMVEEKPAEKSANKVDDVRLERKLKEAFEQTEPFANPRHDYQWYRVNDLARLSNLLFACNMRIPLFANPKILVGLFKYRHLLAGFYRSDKNALNYFVLGVPSKDDTEGKPFENISRWVGSQNIESGDMTGYWLVYINLQNGEFVS